MDDSFRHVYSFNAFLSRATSRGCKNTQNPVCAHSPSHVSTQITRWPRTETGSTQLTFSGTETGSPQLTFSKTETGSTPPPFFSCLKTFCFGSTYILNVSLVYKCCVQIYPNSYEPSSLHSIHSTQNHRAVCTHTWAMHGFLRGWLVLPISTAEMCLPPTGAFTSYSFHITVKTSQWCLINGFMDLKQAIISRMACIKTNHSWFN